MIGVSVNDATALRPRRDDDEGNARTVAEIVERLDEARVVISAAFIKGYENRGFGGELRVGLHRTDELGYEGFEQIELRGLGVAIRERVGLDVGTAGSVLFLISL